MGKGGRKGKKGVYIEEKTDITNRLIHQDGAIQSKKKKRKKRKRWILFSQSFLHLTHITPAALCCWLCSVLIRASDSHTQTHTKAV